MNCDRAFDLMTSPDGLNDPALARHLDVCPRCRQMQETLSPALEWFATDGGGDWATSSHSGSTATPLLSLQAVRVAEAAARDLSGRRSMRDWRRALSIAAMLIAGVAVGVASIDGGRPDRNPPTTSPAGLMTACLWNDPSLRARLPDASSQAVVASCVMCHVSNSVR
jgi:hypothetical protein